MIEFSNIFIISILLSVDMETWLGNILLYFIIVSSSLSFCQRTKGMGNTKEKISCSVCIQIHELYSMGILPCFKENEFTWKDVFIWID